MSQVVQDQEWMKQALALARQAELAGEVPVGAVVVLDNQCIGMGYNQLITRSDPSAHAEVVAIRAAAQHCQNYRLPGSTLYVTLEPCTLCAGAIVQARVSRVVFAASDPKTGALGGHFDLWQVARLNHRIEVVSGILAEEAATCLRDFFKKRRAK